MKKSIYLLFFLISSITISCQKDKSNQPKQYQKYVHLEADYSNQNGKNPLMKITYRDSAIQLIDTNVVAKSDGNGRIKLTFKNVEFKDEFGLYNVDKTKTTTEEYRNGKWIVDSENQASLEVVKDVDVVLVLDLSKSVQTEIIKIKSAANIFIADLFAAAPNTKVAVVAFGNTIEVYPFLGNQAVVTSVINNITVTQSNASKLFEAISTGLDLFSTSTAANKAIVTLSDGNNNSWSTLAYKDITAVSSKLNALADPSLKSPMHSYTIGFNGTDSNAIDANVLDQLEVNGAYQHIDDIKKMNTIFKLVAQKVTCVYNLCYDRNNSPVDLADPIKIRVILGLNLQ